MTQCHDIYSWDEYHGGHRAVPKGAQCHDIDEPLPSEVKFVALGETESAGAAAEDRVLQPA
jgi:hypothetical protein